MSGICSISTIMISRIGVLVIVTPCGVIYRRYSWLLLSCSLSMALVYEYDLIILVLIMFIIGSDESCTWFCNRSSNSFI